MTFDSFDTVFFTLAFLVPGFIWSSVISMLVPRKSRAMQIRLLEFLTLSCVNHGIWAWAVFLLVKARAVTTHPGWTALAMFGIMFASPVILGLLSGWCRQRDRFAWFLGRLGFQTIHAIPTAWDWHFSRQQPYWVLVTLTDGSRVYGIYGKHSFAGDDPAERDLYLEAQFRPTDSGEWAPIEDTGGVLVKASQISAIEFRRVEGVDYGPARQAEE